MAFLLLLLVKAALASQDTLGELPDDTISRSNDIVQYMVNREVHKDIRMNSSSTIRIYSTKEPEDAFFLFSGHCRTALVVMHYYEEIIDLQLVNSSDPAMVVLNSSDTSPGVFITNPHNFSVTVLALARRYKLTDPVPGWCTTRDGVQPEPFLRTTWDASVIALNFSRASLLHGDLECNEKHDFEYEIYHRYLAETSNVHQLDSDFAAALRGFSNVDDIRLLGTRVSSLGKQVDRLLFASYSPLGSLYAVIVHYRSANSSGTGTSLYGLGHTYGCSTDPQLGTCPSSPHVTTNILAGLAVFAGLLMAFAGHRLFITSQGLFGCYAGAFLGLVLLGLDSDLSPVSSLGLTGGCGVVGAAAAVGLWLVLGIPVLSVFLPTLEVGLLAASVLMFLPPLNVPALTTDLFYWLVFLCIVLAVPAVLIAFTQKASILSCVAIGTFTTMVPVDFFLGTNLRYIGINVLRRATVPQFREAVVLPPLQTQDLTLLACWLGMALLALITQLLLERKRAPFPPSPLHLMRWRRELDMMDGSEGETAPLVAGEVTIEATEPQASPVVGYILGYNSVTTGIPVQSHSVQSPVRDSQEIRPAPVQESRRPRPSAPPARGRDIFKPPSPDEGGLPPYSPNML